jgi:hypothetical protein
MSLEARATACAGNNADFYGAVFDAQRLTWVRDRSCWISTEKPPPYYSQLVTLSPENTIEQLARITDLRWLLTHPWSFKDAFCTLDVSSDGFEILFEAQWIWRDPAKVKRPDSWIQVKWPAQLRKWEAAWAANGSPTPVTVFKEPLLDEPGFYVMAQVHNGEIIGGAIANFSEDVVGLSNVFGASFAAAADAVQSLQSDLPVVGYERGDDLIAAKACGFAEVAPLRVWLTGP